MAARLGLISVALLSVALLAPSAGEAKPKPAPAWTQVASSTPEGGLQLGNPKAPLHLIEYASFTCGHCQDFYVTGAATLKARYVATGQLRYEIRPVLRNSADFLGSLLARCGTPAQGMALTEALFKDAATWIPGFQAISESDVKAIQDLAMDEAMVLLADRSKLGAYAAARGIPLARQQVCLKDQANFNALDVAQRQAFETHKITGTPSFVLNGALLPDVNTWAELEPLLKARLGGR
jgi:protein-disulfide isomerase